MTRLGLSALMMLCIVLCWRAQGACQLPPSSAGLGTVTSFTVNSSVSSTSGNINLNCGSGSTLSLLGNNYIRLQLTGATNISGGRAVLKHDNGNDGIPIQLCSTANCSTELTVNGPPVSFNSGQLVNLIGLMGGLNFSLPLYIRTLTGQNVAAGSYIGTLNVLTSYAICTGIGAAGQCMPGGLQSGSAVEPMTVSLAITNDCITITAPNINFGNAPLVTAFSTVSQTITVICTKGSNYTVGLNNGNNAVNNVRNMANGGSLISYDIFKGSGGNRWGDTGGDRWSSSLASGVSSDGTLRSYNYVAEILSGQATPPPGTYSDNLVVDLSF
ncbi:spore coat U domain-containing protein [Sodalis sp. dw_96]|uniref:Csu type fimbrial protein n=1 Tax=Sodalis sp. dw_96 TaxID=2719794 RepID=UPI001BD46100|nr:spore coat U domain-containing protein [Sodalis sp. dw_96]